ncbi:hypothetical protein OIU76_016887 [Salix suchowensis]|nr:hypothetical protein OIU76_016887 [Salix suchowensis]
MTLLYLIDCEEKLASSLFTTFAGGNDYGIALSQNKTIEEVKNSLVPDCVEALKQAVRESFVHGLSLAGCSPRFLTKFSSSNNISASYDGFGCLKNNNGLSMYHNLRLKEGIEELKREYPRVDIVYGDLYSAMQWILNNSRHLGECFFPCQCKNEQ